MRKKNSLEVCNVTQDSESLLFQVYFYSMRQILNGLSLVCCSPGCDIHSIPKVEHLNKFHLRVSKMIKTCLCDRLRRSKLYTDCIEKTEGRRKQFIRVGAAILKFMNRFITIVWDAGDSPKIGSKIRNDDGRSGLNCFFRDKGLVGHITYIFKLYVELVQSLCGYRNRKRWYNNEFISLDKFVKTLSVKLPKFSVLSCVPS